jgi:hypothetical protein
VIFFSFFAKAQKKNPIDKIFTPEEAKTMYQIIDFYDAFVLSKTDTNLPIDEAYKAILENNMGFIGDSGTIDPLVPDEESGKSFFRSLDLIHLKEIFADSFRIRKYGEKEWVTVYLSDRNFAFNMRGKYMQLIKKMGNKNKFYKHYYENAMLCHDVYCPTIYAMLLFENEKINFRKPEERFAFMMIFLFPH